MDDSWSDWVYWYGPFQSNLAAASWSTGHLDVFGVGNDSRMWQKTYDAEMGGWPPKDWSTSEFSDGSGDSDGHYASDPAVAAWPSQQLHLIILGDMGDHNNDHCYHSVYSSGEWSYYNEIAGSFRSQPSLVSWGEGRLDAVALSLDMKVWHRYYDSDQLQWQPVDWQWVGGESDHNLTFGTAPIIVARGPKQLAILAMAESDGSVMYLSGDGMKWGEWISLGKPPEQAKGWSPTSTSEGWVRPASNAPTSSGNIAHLTSSSVSTSRAGLDIGAIVGIAVGVGITVVAAAAALCWYWRKTHLKMQQRPESSIDKAKVLTNAHPAEDTISSAPVQELHADPVKPMLMSHPIADTSGAHELETGLP